ncbi:aspartate/glutamate racemase family protein [Ciceribacter sp. L1K22]|uniref:aspartate/glutamate racemase family protein n=1 Tax=Ciceribacter sp. L1K22 TaxID=2820275 RepID=UPI001ABE50A0|nr:aspartate/glutamate racemase family protein [Ciceribacter sp. L1K22]MBO3760761.1 aspartate/glutamate racemase family protein [Ciceribacter sp. L1K22]
MKTIGLIGGMSFESSAVYYRLINEAVRDRLGGIASAEILMHSLNFAEIVALQKADRWDEAAERLSASARMLERGGAGCVLICTNTMHLVADAVSSAISAPLLNIVDVTADAIRMTGLRRPLLLATRYTMEHGFYTERMRTFGLDPMVPEKSDRGAVHAVIFDELCAGQVKDASRDRYLAIIDKARAAGADCVILGCTEICLLLDPYDLPLPGFDSTRLHCQAAVELAMKADLRQPEFT